jgi:uncharacterized protein (TIGR02145 family)
MVYPWDPWDTDSAGGITNEHGFFKFKQTYRSNNLIVKSEGKIIDSIDLERIGHRRLHWKPFPWQKDPLLGCFDERSADTFFVDMDCKWKSNKVQQGQKRATKRVLRKSVAMANCLPNAAEPSFGTFSDERDGQTYKTVTINGQTWMAQNLNFEPPSGISGCYDDKNVNCYSYGRLYDWETAKQVCPDGWKLPDDEDWKKLVETACGEDFAGSTLKSKRTWKNHYGEPFGNGTDNFGFSALPGGLRDGGDYFEDIGISGYWWIAKPTDTLSYNSGNLHMVSYYNYISVYSASRIRSWFSVRCVADTP